MSNFEKQKNNTQCNPLTLVLTLTVANFRSPLFNNQATLLPDIPLNRISNASIQRDL